MLRRFLAMAVWPLFFGVWTALDVPTARAQTMCAVPVPCAPTVACAPAVAVAAPAVACTTTCAPVSDLIPVTKYFWEAKEIGRWNPFVPTQTVWRLVPRTVWEQRARVLCPSQTSTQPRTYAPHLLNSYSCCPMEGGTSVANAMQPSPDSSMVAGASQPTLAPVHAGQGGGVDSRIAWGTAAPNASLDWSTPLQGPQGAQPTGQVLQSTVASPQTGYGGVARLDDPVRQAR